MIVQDMALLRAQRMQILSTYKGYFLDAAVKRTVCADLSGYIMTRSILWMNCS